MIRQPVICRQFGTLVRAYRIHHRTPVIPYACCDATSPEYRGACWTSVISVKDRGYLNDLTSSGCICRSFTTAQKPKVNLEKDDQEKVNKSQSRSTDPKSTEGAGAKGFDQTKAAAGEETTSEPPKGVSIFQRFKNTYKEHGMVLVGVHAVTSTVWMSIFYYAAST